MSEKIICNKTQLYDQQRTFYFIFIRRFWAYGAIEKIYNDDPTVELFNDDETPKFTSVIQVSMKEHDITIPILDSTKSEGLKELAEENVVNGLIRFLGTPLILANAGRYAQAEFLKGIIEND